MPAKKASLIESMKPSVGLRACMRTSLPLASTEALAPPSRREMTCFAHAFLEPEVVDEGLAEGEVLVVVGNGDGGAEVDDGLGVERQVLDPGSGVLVVGGALFGREGKGDLGGLLGELPGVAVDGDLDLLEGLGLAVVPDLGRPAGG